MERSISHHLGEENCNRKKYPTHAHTRDVSTTFYNLINIKKFTCETSIRQSRIGLLISLKYFGAIRKKNPFYVEGEHVKKKNVNFLATLNPYRDLL